MLNKRLWLVNNETRIECRRLLTTINMRKTCISCISVYRNFIHPVVTLVGTIVSPPPNKTNTTVCKHHKQGWITLAEYI